MTVPPVASSVSDKGLANVRLQKLVQSSGYLSKLNLFVAIPPLQGVTVQENKHKEGT